MIQLRGKWVWKQRAPFSKIEILTLGGVGYGIVWFVKAESWKRVPRQTGIQNLHS